MHGEYILKGGNIFEGGKPTGLWQDKQPPRRLAAASGEPATASTPAVGDKGGSVTAAATATEYTAETLPAVDRPTHHGSETRQTTQVTGRVPQHIKTRLLELGKANGWKESKVVGEACTAYVEQDLGEKFGVRLAGKVTDAVEKGLAKHSTREAYLSVHGYYAAEESRIIATKVLRYLFGEETEIFKQIVRQARQEAYSNLKHKVEEKPETQV